MKKKKRVRSYGYLSIPNSVIVVWLIVSVIIISYGIFLKTQNKHMFLKPASKYETNIHNPKTGKLTGPETIFIGIVLSILPFTLLVRKFVVKKQKKTLIL
jgi:hypothetical protein